VVYVVDVQNGMNGLHLASKEGHINVVLELLARAASVDSSTKVNYSCSERRLRSKPDESGLERWRLLERLGIAGHKVRNAMFHRGA